MIAKDEMLNIFQETGALLSGHFLLTSGLHSPQYFQCALLLQYPQHTMRLCGELANAFSGKEIDLVIAPAIGGIVVAQEVGRVLNKRSIFAEREGGVMSLRRGFSIQPGEKVLVTEDVITTGGSVKEVIDLVEKNGGDVVGVGVIVDRSRGKFTLDVPFIPLLEMDVVVHQPEACPSCKDGIPIVKPGSRKRKS
ncbi:MAG: orotate phosphoribosyltransferase [Gemmatimonadota bacterium]|nr:MAG: orotate phosphoribosyltransferase [Gemmatimonadota bacterium]